jgi:hypothetical protein
MRGALTDLKPQIRDVRLAIRNQTTGGQLDLWLDCREGNYETLTSTINNLAF